MADQFYEDLFDALEANFRSSKVNRATRNAWARRLASLNKQSLRTAVSNLCLSEERLPSLAKILQAYRAVNPPCPSPRYSPTRDEKNVRCLWDAEKKEFLYRAPDCHEGLNFLATLANVAGKTP